jgi:1-acyl-sn-glycerol-3-phosphate acyltransferase
MIWTVIALLTVVFSLMSVATSVLLAPVDRQRRAAHWVNSLWGQGIFWCVPTWRLSVSGRHHIHPRRRYLFVSNHQSMFDIMAVYGLQRQFKWMAKDSLFKVPFLGWAMWAARYIRLVRGLRESIRDSTEQARFWLSQGMSVLIFPEGTRSGTGQMLPFKNGAFKLAIDQSVPIVPVVIDGTWTILSRGGWRVNPRARVRIRILPPVDPTRYGRGEHERLREDVRAMIQATLDRWHAASAGRQAGVEAASGKRSG